MGYRNLYIVNKEIREFARGLGELVLAVIPVIPERKSDVTLEATYLSVSGAQSTCGIVERLAALLPAQRQLTLGIVELPSAITQPLRELTNSVNSFWEEMNREYWMALLAPPELNYPGQFWLNGQLPDYSIVSYSEVVDIFTFVACRGAS
ncbi:MAG: hypothetical protein WCP91_00190 [Candidatus Berkelbacteria bacterium]